MDVTLPCTLGDTRDCIDMRDDNHLVTLYLILPAAGVLDAGRIDSLVDLGVF